MKRPLFLFVLLSFTMRYGLAQTPRFHDSRNTDIPSTHTHFTKFEVTSLQKWEKRKEYLQRQILFAGGLYPMLERTPLNPVVFGKIEENGYTIEKVYLETLPGYYLGGNLFRPLHENGRLPGVLVAHGHWQYGRLESEPLFSGPLLGATLARQGYVAFAYDMVGYNDTMQTPHEFTSPEMQLWTFGSLPLQLWNSTRALDFLESLSDVDPNRVAMTGASGGGTQTFLLTAVDPRVKFVAPANMVSAEMQGGAICENAPGLRLGTFNVEIAAMAAPRPMVLVSTSGDWTHNVPNFEYPAIRKVYALYGKEDNVSNAHFIFPHHNFNVHSRGAVYQFLQKYLTPNVAPHEIVEAHEAPPRLQDMLVFQGRALPPNAKSFDQVEQTWKEAVLASLRNLDTKALREELLLALAAEWPDEVQSSEQSGVLVLTRPGVGDAVPARWFPGKGSPVLIVNPEGSAAAIQTKAFRTAKAAGRPILCIDAFQTGLAKTERPKFAEHYLAFNRSDDQDRAQDILTALAFLHEKTAAPVEIEATGTARIWSLFAAAVAPVPVRIDLSGLAFRGTDSEFLSEFFVPGIQRAGGLATASILLNASGGKP